MSALQTNTFIDNDRKNFVKEVKPHYLSKHFLKASVEIQTTEIQAIFIYSEAFVKSLAKRCLQKQLAQSKEFFKWTNKWLKHSKEK